jgi:hypothetical protein
LEEVPLVMKSPNRPVSTEPDDENSRKINVTKINKLISRAVSIKS